MDVVNVKLVDLGVKPAEMTDKLKGLTGAVDNIIRRAASK
jgi:hypothetical protein